MHPNDLNEFRENIATPVMKQLFDKTQIPEGVCYIDNIELSFLDGRNCGFDTRFQASGLVYQEGTVVEYRYDELDVDLDGFFASHKDCVFISDGRLRIEDELTEMALETKIRNLQSCGKLFFQLEKVQTPDHAFSPIEFEKMKHLLHAQQSIQQGPADDIAIEEDNKTPLVNKINSALSRADSNHSTDKQREQERVF